MIRKWTRTAVLGALFAALLAGGSVTAEASGPRLSDPRPCPASPGFTCSTLTVPLDHNGRQTGKLKLQIATANNADAPKGVMLFLTGGPGQGSVNFAGTIAGLLPDVAQQYRIVMLDQRGTGEFGALNCPTLQEESNSSDVAAPRPEAIRECADIVGPNRRFYRTDDTLADLDLLRRALGAETMTIDGISYGTFTAARYALAHPRNVRRLVLDSVWPYVDPQRDEPLFLTPMQAHRRVLRDACKSLAGCDWDPVADLARLVRTRGDGVTLLDLMVVQGFQDPSYGTAIRAMHKARQGDPADLNALIATMQGADPPPLDFISWGLYTATFCADSRFPWGDSSASLKTRQAALDDRVERLRPSQVYPYDGATAAGVGFVQRCLPWPVTSPSSEPPRNSTLSPVPTLLLAGDRDLPTPAEWAYEVAARTPRGKVVEIAGGTHVVQIQAGRPGDEGRAAITRFLND